MGGTMTRRTLQILVVVLSLALLAACFRIYSMSSENKSTANNGTVSTQKNSSNRSAANASGSSSPSVQNVAPNNNAMGQGNHYANGITTIDYAALPKEAQTVIQMIQKRASFPYRQDGQTFSNRERVLPSQSRGYYQEYTVPTPGADNRGARRIVSGLGNTGDNATSGEYYYTSDHYRSFARVRME